MNGAVPIFSLDQGGFLLALLRGCAVASLLSLFGTLVFDAVVAPLAWGRPCTDGQAALDRCLRRWAWTGFGVSAALLLLWLPVQAGAVASSTTVPRAFAAVPALVLHLRFGQLLVAQLVCLLAAALAFRLTRPKWPAILLAGLAVGLHVGHTHAAADHPGFNLLLISDLVHLLAAGIWLGGLAPLLLMVRRASPGVGAAMCRHYSPVGKLCLVAMLTTAVIQFWELIGGLPGLVGTEYGWTALVKLALFGVLFGFAWVNRYRLAPALLGEAPQRARRNLSRSIAVQTLVALVVVLAAGVLSQLPPAIHVQPVWPFAQRFSLVTVQEDPEFGFEVLRALGMLGAGLAMLAIGFVRAWRWSSLTWVVVSGILIALALPHLDLLFLPATPASFYRSPTGFSAVSIAAGASSYSSNCVSCHGVEGRGDGVRAAQLPSPPSDLTAAHLWEHSDGELYGWLTRGMPAPDGSLAMPGFAGTLSDDDIWALIDFVRARNGGITHRETGQWPVPLQAPGFQMMCQDGAIRTLAEQRGRILRLVFGPAAAAPGVLTVVAAAAAVPAPDVCTVDDGALRTAYAVITGVPDASLTGLQVLIDGAGWIRAVHDDTGATAWLADAIKTIATQTIDAARPVSGHHL